MKELKTKEYDEWFKGFKFPSVHDEYKHLLDEGYQSIITGIPKDELERVFGAIIEVEQQHYLVKL